ncbi:uncharacterized protein LOC105249236 [Camponotus floridanus]|uniref:uncharacterized protein LOC105249236 n=1 Tax=Camponotus floridanus TaxID=104421 RepID=UPI0009716109|nr:uncharacterized protein LOC105249236 [Camponotus floridanus]
MRMGLVFVKVYRESIESKIIMKIMFLISVILILLLQLCNAQLDLPILPTLPGDILDEGRQNQNNTSHSSENGDLPILSTLTRNILKRLNDRENQNNEPHSSGNNGLPILSLLTRSMDRGQSNRNREKPEQ